MSKFFDDYGNATPTFVATIVSVIFIVFFGLIFLFGSFTIVSP